MAANQDPSGAPTLTNSKNQHPLYRKKIDEWQLCLDVFEGEQTIKQKGLLYLPALPGHVLDGLGTNQRGLQDYTAYMNRAVWYDVFKDAVQTLTGIMHRKPPKIELPKSMEPLRDRCTPDGEGLEDLLRKVNINQLKYGRVGLLVDVPSGQAVGKTMPYIALYEARNILNWDTGVSDSGDRKIEMVMLDESAWERRETLDWKYEQKVRILLSDMGQLNASVAGAQPGFITAMLRDGKVDPAPEDFVQPSIGGKPLDKVPFVFINANDLVPDPEQPPLFGLANLAIKIYQADADLRHNLYMQGQETLVVIGNADESGKKVRTGAGAVLDLPRGADAKYVGVSGRGLSEQAAAVEKLLAAANERGVRLLEFQDARAASGESLKVRVAARTTTIVTISRSSCAGLEQALKYIAEWIGANPDEVKVTPNTDYADSSFTGQDALYWTQAKNAGFPVSEETMHNMLVANEISDMSYDEERSAIDGEEPLPGSAGAIAAAAAADGGTSSPPSRGVSGGVGPRPETKDRKSSFAPGVPAKG